MKYEVASKIFEMEPQLTIGIIIGKNIQNSGTNDSDLERLRNAEAEAREKIQLENLRDWPTIQFYRETMKKAGINPNRFPVSVEAMMKRILKGGSLPAINALVDLCNAISLEQAITLGAHDLEDIEEDLALRFATGVERFLPFGETKEEAVEPGELIFTSHNTVQTRKWIWRQSERGKTTVNSQQIFFQLVSNSGEEGSPLHMAMKSIEKLVENRFGGSFQRFVIDRDHPVAEF
ncbi:B3/B4 domain-containing protein (DNA/RNA-binding domain of Phe-tRNA-synthetase) [Tindallia magadiensis]|uniref:B3/B4 domain-containing protein (DNA/RNA-binding domain of Phe-tRNA-synthetase) n=1 Tax=Tindallia magadiensis TaxID=69895 RepID=A0A1I3BSH4_9FIRM|nr:phenylalanine--tRNA ligase beta subunit-related protein [Tindallia magadiensis]SFH65222.1 B3/B4 domain-containing protein (DNA/RNA-binding domain of Phe-tRNA-synthetase) [Tindallia magadiensis]